MATAQANALVVEPREPAGSRAARQLRRTGKVPGVVYGGGDDPVAFAVDSRDLRQALAHAGAVLELKIGDAGTSPVVLKELIRHPVTGVTTHIDLLRVRLDQAIHAMVVVELTGSEDAPGVKEGGVLEQVNREVSIEALPNDIPDLLTHDVSAMQIGDTVTIDALEVPSAVTLLDDSETIIATLSPPRLVVEDETEIEEETELVGEGEGGEAGEGAEGEGGEQGGGDSEGESSE
jgi:large subunit ribosomal protein L25